MKEMTADTARGQILSPEAQKINEIIKHLNKTEPEEGVGVEQLGRTRLTRADHHRKINELVREVTVLRECLVLLGDSLRHGNRPRHLADDFDFILGMDDDNR